MKYLDDEWHTYIYSLKHIRLWFILPYVFYVKVYLTCTCYHGMLLLFMLLLVFAYDVLSGSKARDDSLALVGDASFIVVEIG